jgi:hypothetical protein
VRLLLNDIWAVPQPSPPGFEWLSYVLLAFGVAGVTIGLIRSWRKRHRK